jgi:hypothetical protein
VESSAAAEALVGVSPIFPFFDPAEAMFFVEKKVFEINKMRMLSNNN